jgi:hypothetical protein
MMPEKPSIPDVLPLVKAYFQKPGNEAGGLLHVVLDDGNVESPHILFAMEQCLLASDEDGHWLCIQLLRMSRTQRKKLSAMTYRWDLPELPVTSNTKESS